MAIQWTDSSEPRPLVGVEGSNQVVDRLSEGEIALAFANVQRAIVDGGLGARWQLGALIGKLLTEPGARR